MEAKEVLAKVKLMFTELMAPAQPPTPPAPDAPKEYEIKSGGKCTIDKLEAGGIVMIDGNPSLPGDLELADGTKLTVGDNGVITAVTPASPAAPDPAADMGAKFTEFETSVKGKFEAYEQKFAAYEQRFLAYEEKMKKANAVTEQLLQLATLIVEKPAAAPDPAAKIQSNFKEEKENKFIDNLSNGLFN